jgi:hypothetical protein
LVFYLENDQIKTLNFKIDEEQEARQKYQEIESKDKVIYNKGLII